MTTDEKLKHFEEISMVEARLQREKIVEDYKKNLKTVFESHKTETQKKANLQIKVETDAVQKEINKIVSKEQIDIRRQIQKKQHDLRRSLFEEVADLIKEYCKTDEYKQLLIKQINDAKDFAKDLKITIYIDPIDADKLEELQKATDTSLVISEYSFMGGTRAVILSNHILIDNSFETKLSEAKSNYRFGGNVNA